MTCKRGASNTTRRRPPTSMTRRLLTALQRSRVAAAAHANRCRQDSGWRDYPLLVLSWEGFEYLEAVRFICMSRVRSPTRLAAHHQLHVDDVQPALELVPHLFEVPHLHEAVLGM